MLRLYTFSRACVLGHGGAKLFSWAGEHSLGAGAARTSAAGTREGDLCPGVAWRASRSKQTGRGNRYRRGSAGDQPGLSDNTPAVLNFYPFLSSPTADFL